MALTFRVEDDELPGLLEVLRRACNTWAPADQPAWVQDMVDSVEARLAKLGHGLGPVPRPLSGLLGMLRCFNEGQEAYRNSVPWDKNPHPADTPEFKSWSNGWVPCREAMAPELRHPGGVSSSAE